MEIGDTVMYTGEIEHLLNLKGIVLDFDVTAVDERKSVRGMTWEAKYTIRKRGEVYLEFSDNYYDLNSLWYTTRIVLTEKIK